MLIVPHFTRNKQQNLTRAKLRRVTLWPMTNFDFHDPLTPDVPPEVLKARYTTIAERLVALYGPVDWRPTLPPVDELINTILSQNTSDLNRDRGFNRLKERFPTWEAVRDAPVAEVIAAIQPAGLSNQKAPRIQIVLRKITAEQGAITLDFLKAMPIETARAWLMHLDGVGPKTAAIVLLFALGRPAFPVDTHIYRLTRRWGLVPLNMNVERAHDVMAALVPPETYYQAHLNIIWHGRAICHARNPECLRCPLTDVCAFYQHPARFAKAVEG